MPEEQKQGEKGDDSKNIEVPEGIKPVFLSSATQAIFGCEADVNITSDKPHVFLSKEKLLEDIHNRAAVSDFQPLKKIIKNYPQDELLLVYDYEFKYEQNFYLCITEEAKELVLNPPETDIAGGSGDGKGDGEGDEEDVPIPVTPIPQPWECLGSDKEIKEGMVVDSRPGLQFVVTKKRQYFSGPYFFTDNEPRNSGKELSNVKDLYVEFSSVPLADEVEKVYRLELETGVQAIPETVDQSTQTTWRHPKNATVQYEPRVFDKDTKAELWNSKDMLTFMNTVTPLVEIALQQNEIMDIFPDDYLNLSDNDGIMISKSDSTLKEYQSFTDLRFSKDKVVTWIDWHPTVKGIIAVSCGLPYSHDERVEISFKIMHMSSLILLWSFADPIHPQLFLEAPEDIVCFKFNPSNPNLIAAGCINGQLVIWDITEYQDRLQINRNTDSSDNASGSSNMAIFDTEPKLDHAPIVQCCVLSSIEGGHTRSLTDVSWIPDHIEICHKTLKIKENSSGISCQLISTSLDGHAMFWDLRHPSKRQTQNTKGPKIIDPNNPFSYIHLTWKPFYKVPLPRTTNPGLYASTRISLGERPIPKPPKQHQHIETEEAEGDTDVGGASGGMMPHQLEIGSGGNIIDEKETKFCLGSEEGELIFVNWLPTKDQESGKLVAPKPNHFFFAHAGTVNTIERSPFFPKVILTVGGWNFCIWRDGLTSGPLLASNNSSVLLSTGAWSPTRQGVFFIAKHNGNIDIWDLMDRSDKPALAQNISSLSITYIIPWKLSSRQLMLAAGDSGGTLHILEVPWSLSHASNSEQSAMELFFDREVKRLEFVGERNQMREQQKKEMDDQKINEQEAERKGETPAAEENWEDTMRNDYTEYLKMENEILIKLGLRKPDVSDD